MAVPLSDGRALIEVKRPGPRDDVSDPRAEPHGAADGGHVTLFLKQADHGMRRGFVKLGTVRALEVTDVAREFNHGDLHAQTDPEIRDLLLAREPGRGDFAFDAAVTESAG